MKTILSYIIPIFNNIWESFSIVNIFRSKFDNVTFLLGRSAEPKVIKFQVLYMLLGYTLNVINLLRQKIWCQIGCDCA